jgi:hypothetical protein
MELLNSTFLLRLDAREILVLEVARLLPGFGIGGELQVAEVAEFVVITTNLNNTLAIVLSASLGLHDLAGEHRCRAFVLEQYDCNVA